MRHILVGLACGIFFTGCVAITSASVDSVVGKGGPKVMAEAGGVGILSLTVPDVKALEGAALDKLRSQGATKNVTSRLQMRNWFGFVQVYQVMLTGEKVAGGKDKGDAKSDDKAAAKPPVAE